jgi:serine/threonine-protein kinase
MHRPDGPAVARATYDLWTGDFADLIARSPERNAAEKDDQQETARAWSANMTVTALMESGRNADAGRAAAAFLAARRMLPPTTPTANFEEEEAGLVLAAARETGQITKEDAASRAREWLAPWTADAGRAIDRYRAWIVYRALGAVTKDDAETSLAFAIPPVSLKETSIEGAALGNVYALLGRWDDALPHLERASRTCVPLEEIGVTVRARSQLAQAYEAKGNTQAACEAYGWIVDLWGGAKPRSVTAEKAAARRRALGCGR